MEEGSDYSYSYYSSTESSSYGYISSTESATLQVVRVRPRSFHLPRLSAALLLATPLERAVLDREERPSLSTLERCLGSATVGGSVLLLTDAETWCILSACSRESQLCLLHHLHLEA